MIVEMIATIKRIENYTYFLIFFQICRIDDRQD